jgi:hypothetical protein
LLRGAWNEEAKEQGGLMNRAAGSLIEIKKKSSQLEELGFNFKNQNNGLLKTKPSGLLGGSPRLKDFLVKELEQRGIDKYSRNLKEVCSEL